MNKKQSRIRRSKRTRSKIEELLLPRLTVHKTSRHIYVQLITPTDRKVLASANTLQKSLKGGLKNSGNIDAATKVGASIAEKAKESGIKKVAFDRSGFKYHGRIKALADAARESGLEF